MKFKTEHVTQTELGQIFGVSSHVIGDWFVEVGLKTETKHASGYAHNGGFITTVSNKSWGYKWMWHAQKTVTALIEAGHHPVSPPPGNLIEPSTIKGPFICRLNENGTHEIVGNDGFPAVWVVGDHNATVVTKLLNLADQSGVIERMAAKAQNSNQQEDSGPIETPGFSIIQ